MNNKKIDFIICSNNMRALEECKKYINHLEIPIGYDIDIIAETHASSMVSGYNTSMKHSSAKYKVYLHHDVYIVNKTFIQDILNIFDKYPQTGMIGVLGASKIQQEGFACASWDIGAVNMWYGKRSMQTADGNDKNTAAKKVLTIDGMIMVTQHDLCWREDILDGWHFYDVTQSFEFLRAGYEIRVPYQEEPWCIHDCGINNLKGYDKYREIVLDEYTDMYTDIRQKKNFEYSEKVYNFIENQKQALQKFMENNQLVDAQSLLNDPLLQKIMDTELCILNTICNILVKEQSLEPSVRFNNNCANCQVLIDKYKEIQFIFRRIEFGMGSLDATLDELAIMQLSEYALEELEEVFVFNNDRISKILSND